MSNRNTQIYNHFVFTPKFRRPVLTGPVARHFDQIAREVCAELHCEIIALAIQPDHVHLLVQMPPTLTASQLAQSCKGRSSRLLRQAHPHLLALPALWGHRYFVRSVGGGRRAVQKYIDAQGI